MQVYNGSSESSSDLVLHYQLTASNTRVCPAVIQSPLNGSLWVRLTTEGASCRIEQCMSEWYCTGFRARYWAAASGE